MFLDNLNRFCTMKASIKYILTWTVFLLCLLVFRQVSAAEDVNLSWKLSKTTDAALNPDQLKTDWINIERNRIREGYNPDPTWLKMEITNAAADTQTCYWVISNSYIDTVDYWQDGKHLFQTGIAFQFSQRPLEEECFVLPFKVAPHSTSSVFTRLAIRNGTLSSRFFLLDKNGFENWSATRNRFNAFYLIVVFNVLLIALVVSLISGRAIMINYAFYLASFIFFQLQILGYAYHYLWPGFPVAAYLGKGLIQLFGCYLFWLFCAELTGFSKLNNLVSVRFKKPLHLLLWSVVSLAVALNIIGYYHPLTYLIIATCFVYIIAGYIDLIICVRHKFRPAYGVFAGVCFPLVATTLVTLRGGNLLPDWAIIDYAYPIGYMTEVVVILIFTVYFMRRQNRFHIVRENRFRYHQDFLRRMLPEMKAITSHEEMQQVLSEEIKVSHSYPAEVLEKDFILLSQLVSEQKLYKNPELNMHFLAKYAGLPFARASRAINTLAKKNFSEWMNEYRVEEAKLLLHSREADKYTFDAIGEMAGFKSRSSFYSVFKRVTGYMPSEYKALESSAQIM